MCTSVCTGMNFCELSREFRLGRATVSTFVPEVLDAIYKTLQPLFMQVW